MAGQKKHYKLKDLLDYNAERPSSTYRPMFLYVLIKAAKLTYAQAKIVIDNIDLGDYDDAKLRIPVMKHIHTFKLLNNFTDKPYIIPNDHRDLMERLQIEGQDHCDSNESDRTRIERVFNSDPEYAKALTTEESVIIKGVVVHIIQCFHPNTEECDAFIHNLVIDAVERTHGNTKDYSLHKFVEYVSNKEHGGDDFPVYLYVMMKATKIKFSDARRVIDDALIQGNFPFTDDVLRSPVMKWIRSKGLQNNFMKIKNLSGDLVKMFKKENITKLTEDMSDYDGIGNLLGGDTYKGDFTNHEIFIMERIHQYFSKNRVRAQLHKIELVYTKEYLIANVTKIFGTKPNKGYSQFLHFIHKVCQECNCSRAYATVFASEFKTCFDTAPYKDYERDIKAYIHTNVLTDGLKDFYAKTIRKNVMEAFDKGNDIEVLHGTMMDKLDELMKYNEE